MDPGRCCTMALLALVGCGSALVVLGAGNLIATTGPISLAIAGICSVAAAAAIVLLSTGEGQT